MNLHIILARQFLRKSNQFTHFSCQQELVPIQSITGKASGRWSTWIQLVDTSSRHWLRLWFKPLCIQFVRFATLYSYLALHVLLHLCDLPPYTVIWHNMFIRHTRVGPCLNRCWEHSRMDISKINWMFLFILFVMTFFAVRYHRVWLFKLCWQITRRISE